jgi:hypothetical protein
MSNAAIVIFHRPPPREDKHYQTQSKLFFKYADAWLKFIDTFYIVDSGWGLNHLPKNARVIQADHRAHWENLNLVIPKVEEDNLLILDSDMLIYDPAVVKDGYDKLKTHECSAILDNSGQVVLEKEYHQLAPNKNRAVRRRIAPYLCFIKTARLLHKDFTPFANMYDSMGRITAQLFNEGIKLHELPDDRSTLRLDEHGELSQDTWLDGPGYAWSEPLDKPVRRGYYHVRNSTFGPSMITEWIWDREAYTRRKQITPFTEAMRLLAWQWIYDDKANELKDWLPHFSMVLEDYQVSPGTWDRYIRHFYEYHRWLTDEPKVER